MKNLVLAWLLLAPLLKAFSQTGGEPPKAWFANGHIGLTGAIPTATMREFGSGRYPPHRAEYRLPAISLGGYLGFSVNRRLSAGTGLNLNFTADLIRSRLRRTLHYATLDQFDSTTGEGTLTARTLQERHGFLQPHFSASLGVHTGLPALSPRLQFALNLGAFATLHIDRFALPGTVYDDLGPPPFPGYPSLVIYVPWYGYLVQPAVRYHLSQSLWLEAGYRQYLYPANAFDPAGYIQATEVLMKYRTVFVGLVY